MPVLTYLSLHCCRVECGTFSHGERLSRRHRVNPSVFLDKNDCNKERAAKIEHKNPILQINFEKIIFKTTKRLIIKTLRGL
jgi:hypothetical protein